MKLREQGFFPENSTEPLSFCNAALEPVFELNHAVLEALVRGAQGVSAATPTKPPNRLGALLNQLSLLLAACLVVVFAPAGREYVASWIGAALLVTVAGAAGYKRIRGKSRNISFGADQGEGESET